MIKRFTILILAATFAGSLMAIGPQDQAEDIKPVGVNFEWSQDERGSRTTLIVYDLGLPEDGTEVNIPNSTLVYWNDDVSSPHFIDRRELALIPGHRYQWHIAVEMPLGIALSEPATFIAGPKFAPPEQEGVVWEKWRLIDRNGGRSNESVGTAVAIDQGFAAVAGMGEKESWGQNGRIIVHQRTGDRWADVAQLGSYMGQGHRDDGFGRSVALHAGLIAGGAPATEVDENKGVGAVYLFRDYGDAGSGQISSRWAHEYTLTPHTRVTGSRFGFSVDVEDDRVLVGAPGERNQDGSLGAVYLFTYMGTHWEETQRWTPTKTTEDGFGEAVAMTGGTVAISSSDRERGEQSVHLLDWDGSAWTRSGVKLPAGERTGIDLDLSEETLVVGVSGDHDEGAVFVFEGSGEGLELVSSFESIPTTVASVAISGEIILVGHATASDGGASVYRRGEGGWGKAPVLRSSVGQAEDANGSDVAICMTSDGSYLAMTGSPGVDQRRTNQGAAYLYPIPAD